jgi:proteasome-associated ATPase
MEQILRAGSNPLKLQHMAIQLLAENNELQHSLAEVAGRQEELRQAVETLVAPEHYSCVVTDVQRNGHLTAQVQCRGMSPLQVRVHPDVNTELLCVGAVGYLGRSRNCLVGLSDSAAAWTEVGTFEEYLPGGSRVLVRSQEQSIALNLADSLRETTLRKGDRIGFDREQGAMAFVRLPKTECAHLFSSDMPDDDFSQLGGLESQIEKIKQAIDFRYRFPHLADRYKLPSKQGILLEGPPGNGKTRLARCAANYIGRLSPGVACRFMAVNGSEDLSMWLGGTEARLKERFAAAREAAREGLVVLFFDEIDAIARRRGADIAATSMDRILSTFLGQLDDVHKSLSNVVIIAATNRADQLDPALLRPGRLDLKLSVPFPSRSGADAILRGYLGRGLPLSAPISELITPLISSLYAPRGAYASVATVKLSDGRQLTVRGRELVSGAVLEAIVRRASQAAASREADSGRSSGIVGDDLACSLEAELESTARLLSPANVKNYVLSIPQDAHPVEVTPAHFGQRRYVRL